jgi:hypothetical protein
MGVKIMDAGDIIALIGVILGLTVFSTGLIQYVKAQNWKKAEFVANEMKEFESRHAVIVTMQMLDWNKRWIELYPEKELKERNVIFKDEILETALMPHYDYTKGYERDEVRIRDYFDIFLDGLERFEHFIQSGLIKIDDIKPYLDYWIHLIGQSDSKRKSIEFYSTLWNYIDSYEYIGIQNLLKRFGYDIAPK